MSGQARSALFGIHIVTTPLATLPACCRPVPSLQRGALPAAVAVCMEVLHLVLGVPLRLLDPSFEDHDLLLFSGVLALLVTESIFDSLEHFDVVL